MIEKKKKDKQKQHKQKENGYTYCTTYLFNNRPQIWFRRKSAEALSLRACRGRANPPNKSTNPPLNPRGEGFMPPPYPPPRLRLAHLLAAVPGDQAPRPLQNRYKNPSYVQIDF